MISKEFSRKRVCQCSFHFFCTNTFNLYLQYFSRQYSGGRNPTFCCHIFSINLYSRETLLNFFEFHINLDVSVDRKKNAGFLQRILSHSWKAWNHIRSPAVGPHNVNREDYCIASKLARHCIIYGIIVYHYYVLTYAVIYVAMSVSIEYYNIDKSQESIP